MLHHQMSTRQHRYKNQPFNLNSFSSTLSLDNESRMRPQNGAPLDHSPLCERSGRKPWYHHARGNAPSPQSLRSPTCGKKNQQGNIGKHIVIRRNKLRSIQKHIIITSTRQRPPAHNELKQLTMLT